MKMKRQYKAILAKLMSYLEKKQIIQAIKVIILTKSKHLLKYYFSTILNIYPI